MLTTIITDCRDANAAGRQIARAGTLLPFPVSLVGVQSDLEAAGNLIDILDGLEGRESVVLVNVAPRHAGAKKWPNGTPFSYFWYQKTLVVASIDGLTLSLVKKLGLTDAVHVMDIPTALDEMITKGALDASLRDYIVSTQFRSLEFVPRVAAYLWTHKSIVSTPLVMTDIPDAPATIWWTDNFGNCKTTVLADERTPENGTINTTLGALPYFDRLKDVPNDTTAVIAGSSGLGAQRFLEIVVQGKSAAQAHDLQSGSEVFA